MVHPNAYQVTWLISFYKYRAEHQFLAVVGQLWPCLSSLKTNDCIKAIWCTSQKSDSKSQASFSPSLFSGLCTAGRLELNPRKSSVTKLAGEDKSFFISCIPISHTGPVSDSRIKAKELSWKKRQNPAIGNGWVTLGSVQHTRYVISALPKKIRESF